MTATTPAEVDAAARQLIAVVEATDDLMRNGGRQPSEIDRATWLMSVAADLAVALRVQLDLDATA